MIRVIVESPYAGATARIIERNERYLRACLRDCLLRGEAPFASHGLFAVNELAAEGTCEVSLSRGKVALIDEGDLERVSQFNWFAIGEPGREYAARNVRVGGGKQQTIYMHRFILDAGDAENEVDHENGVRLDNRRSNLRIATHSENMANQVTQARNVSGLKGVRIKGAKWQAYISTDGEQRHLGTFGAAEDAAKAYDRAAFQLFGRFARTNFTLPGVLEDAVRVERELGIRAGFAWRPAANKTVVYEDFGVSAGMEAGIAHAESIGQAVERRTLKGKVLA